MVNSIFHNGKYTELEQAVFERLKHYSFDMSDNSISSTRGVGDSIENVISQEFGNIISKTSIFCSDYSTDFARRAMADIAFTIEDTYYISNRIFVLEMLNLGGFRLGANTNS